MRTISGAVPAIALSFALLSCAQRPAASSHAGTPPSPDRTAWFPEIVPDNLAGAQGAWFIKDIKGYQQTADHTCGPAALMAVAAFHHPGRFTLDRKTEMAIASEAGSRPMDVLAHGGKPGTTPAEMMRWLETHGFDVRVDYEERGDGSALRRLQANITNGIPTIVEWADLGGHWVVAVGYDSRDNDDPWDDVIVFADSFDRYDDHQDGYTFVNANKFYWLWYDAFYFDKLTWRTMITATPRHAPHRDK